MNKHDPQQGSNMEDLGSKYLHGNMSAEQLRDYEVFLLEHPEQVDDLAMSALFKRNLQYASFKQPTKWWSLPQLMPVGMTLAACSFAFVIALNTGLLGFNSNTQEVRSPAITYVETFRGTNSATSVHFGRDDRKHVLVSPLDTLSTGSVTVTIESPQKKQAITYKQIPNSNNEVVIELRRSALIQGVYRLKIEDSESREILVEQPILVSID